MICRWLFYIEGGITILVAVCAMFILPDFPHNTRWFTPEESELLFLALQKMAMVRLTSLGSRQP
ncbi:hypothetical protein C8R48DRAFT_611815 [Suillus tomentosus]|nr:hypothetical protein C8R48DRAFT_611815 [Suillus tomentosus]